jgi:AcrR family transcriptional regulator
MDRKWDPILKAAKMLFLEKGIAATSMDEVAIRSRATKRTVYNNFGSKERLVEAVFKEAMDEFRVAAPVLAKNGGPDQLQAFAVQALMALANDYAIGFQRMIIAEGQRHPEMTSMLLGSAFGVLLAPLAQWIGAKGDRTEVDAEKHARVLIETLTARARLDRLLGLRTPYPIDARGALDALDAKAVEDFMTAALL